MRTILSVVATLAILSSQLGCEAKSGGAAALETPGSPRRMGPKLRRMDHECEAGDKISCYLLAGAYETGEAPRIAFGEIVVRDMTQAAYFESKACALGELNACQSLADQYAKGDGVSQDHSRAAALYDKACNGGVSNVTDIACTHLGDSYVNGIGVKADFRRGMALLKRACNMGCGSACTLSATYGGTGNFIDAKGPGGAMGFSFGWSIDETQRACSANRGRWSRHPTDASAYICDLRIAALDREARVIVVFIRSLLVEISAFYPVEPGAAVVEYGRVGDLLTQTYGVPSHRVSVTPDGCGGVDLGGCLVEKRAEYTSDWLFRDRTVVSVSLGGPAAGGIIVQLEYNTSEALNAVGHPGL
jgi:TPR repeat protein